MRILYLIGNGFDIHVGLKTAYPSFLKYYLEQPLPTDIDERRQGYITRLKDDIKGNIKLWSALELQFGKHMSKLGKGNADNILEELDIINDDIRNNLSKYIALQDEKSFFTDNASKTFIKDLVAPELHLRDFEKSIIANQKTNAWRGTVNVVDIVSFNYTHTIEHLLGKAPEQTYNNGVTINEPVHVHGYHDNRMIMGVDNINQIENDELKKLTYATETLVKSQCNHTYGVSHTDQTTSLINNAQFICIYGMSFGDTDKTWWRTVCSALKSRGFVYVIIFWHEDKLPNYSNSGPKLENLKRRVVNNFLAQGGIENPTRAELAKRIYVSVNDPIFDIQIKNLQDNQLSVHVEGETLVFDKGAIG